jgi:ABC-2 type transport system ATP-binding protein
VSAAAAPGIEATEARQDGRILARGIARSFGGKPVLRPTDLEIEAGSVAGLLGPNGSGKSTLLRCLLGLVSPDSGGARIDGVGLAGDGTAVRRRVAYAPGEIALYGEMRGREHLDWLLRGRGDGARARARSIAGDFGLPLERRVRTFSHGMKRQLLLAAALAPDVRVRILDEATEGLDPTRRGEVLERLRDDAARGTTILLSSHHLGEVDRVCGLLVFLSEGRKIAEESSAAVAARARRIVRMTFDAGADMASVARYFEGVPGARLALSGTRATVDLADGEPSALLGAALSSTAIPRPRAVACGELSLQELYREVYGVEGC